MGIEANAIYCCDSLDLLERMDAEHVALAYLDPPWLEEQIKARSADRPKDKDKIESFEEKILQEHLNFLLKVYQQVHRVMTSQGVLLLHSDQSLQAYTQIILNQIFGRRNYRHAFVIPKRPYSSVSRGPGYETVLMYSKSDDYYYDPSTRRLTADEVSQRFPSSDATGRYRLIDLTTSVDNPSRSFEVQGVLPPKGRSWKYDRERMEQLEREGLIVGSASRNLPRLKDYLHDHAETPVGDVWTDLPPLPIGTERTGWPAQRPRALLDRIITMASEEGSIVLDPFCGSGTALERAQALGRRWIGSDIAEEAIDIAVSRLETSFGITRGIDFAVGGQTDLERDQPTVYAVYPVINTGMNIPRTLDFVLNQVLPIEETRHFEFKDISTSRNPARSIQATADEYAVAFLNSEGGRVFWGVRDDRTVAGVQLGYGQRDEVRRQVSSSLTGITPPIAPTSYRLEFYPVRGPDGEVPDLFVVELSVPRVSSRSLFFTNSQEAWIKTDGGKKKLIGQEIVQEALKRHSLPDH